MLSSPSFGLFVLVLARAYLSSAAPIATLQLRTVTSLNADATAEAQVRDNTATRAFSAVPIATSDGKCLFVDELSGDFRANLTPVQAVACDSTVAGQQWDIITAGVHNNVPGQALIVSAKTQACLNFDSRRAPGNQVLLFSCGGRADGGGQVTDAQQFAFTGKTQSIALTPKNSATTCLTVVNGKLDQSTCTPATASGQQLFTIGATGASAPAASSAPVASSIAPVPPSSSALAVVSTTAVLEPAPVSSAATSAPTGTTKLDAAAVAEAQVRDDTATRAKSSIAIKTSTGKCLSVDAQSGDFRENLIPVEIKTCDGSGGQQFDVITKGKHNDQAGQALIVSTLTQGCLNFDDRRAAGNQVLLFSCGGRADGSGAVTNSQLFAFDGTSATIPLVPANTNQGRCLFDNAGKLHSEACTAATPKATELFTLGDAAFASPAPVASAAPIASSAAASSASSAVLVPAPVSSAPAAVSTGTTKLDVAAVAEAQVRDDTATRAKSGIAIKTSTGKCLSVDAQSGDFRENLIPIELKTCDGSAGQQFDVITKGKHNDQAGQALIVSTLTQGCLNFDDRRAAGNQVLLFSCGGRADGGGAVTNSQLFAFDGTSDTIPLVPANTNQGRCLFDNAGKLDSEACAAATPKATELFTLG